MSGTIVESMDCISLAQDWERGDGLLYGTFMSNGMTVLQFI
jgi:hypothetical protein